MISISTAQLLTKACAELNAVDLGGTMQPELADFALETLNEILDLWNAERGKVYADSFLPFTIIPNQNPTTIGPSADWNTTQRPVSIDGIQVELTGTPTPFVYVKPRSAAWWQAQPSPTTTATFPTDFYYDPTWTTAAPYGSVYLWPVPTQAYDVQVRCRIILGQLTANQTISLPPGYNRAVMLTLARAMAQPLRKPWTPAQEQAWMDAVSKIESNNVVVPQIRTADSGMPMSGGGSGLPTFFWPNGLLR